MRPLNHKLILSTLPHVCSMYWAIQVSSAYAALIGISTCASILWHHAGEPRNQFIFYIDYGLAGVWVVADLYYANNAKTFITILALNTFALVTNHIRIPRISYETTHSVWHCISWSKACLVAYILSKNLSDFHATSLNEYTILAR